MTDKLPPPLKTSYWVVPGHFLAGEYPGEPEPELTIKKLRVLMDAGIRTFVDLTDEDEISEDARLIPPYRSLLREVSQEERLPTTYINIPVEDRGVPSIWTLRCILSAIDCSIDDENPVYVHCWAGRGRTGTVVGCYLKRHGIAQDDDLMQQLAHLRRQVPTAKEISPHTKEQIRMVINWKKGS